MFAYIQVGRNTNPETDAELVHAIAMATGPNVSIRCDANRLWTLHMALRFARRLAERNCTLEYLEEPVENPEDLAQFAREGGIPVAVDESIDDGAFMPCAASAAQSTSGTQDLVGCIPGEAVSAMVIKPSLLGSLERTCALLRWGALHGVKCVISSTFESPVGMAVIGSVAAAADSLQRQAGQSAHAIQSTPVATGHGLGTLTWFEASRDEPISVAWLPVLRREVPGAAACASMHISDMHAVNQRMCAIHAPAAVPLQSPNCDADARNPELKSWQGTYAVTGLDGRTADIRFRAVSRSFSPGEVWGRDVLLFVHGFMGTSEDWLPVMHGMAASGYTCYAIDLPGHGGSRWVGGGGDGDIGTEVCEPCLHDYSSILRSVVECVHSENDERLACEYAQGTRSYPFRMFQPGFEAPELLDYKLCIVGYSLGARLALEALAEFDRINLGEESGVKYQVVAISASPGIQGEEQAQARVKDDACAASLLRSMHDTQSASEKRHDAVMLGSGSVNGGPNASIVVGPDAGPEVEYSNALRRAGVLADFVEAWYSTPLWDSLRQHPRFSELVARRVRDGDPSLLADVLEQCSSGCQNGWSEVQNNGFGCDVDFIVGELDAKFISIAHSMTRADDSDRHWKVPDQCRGEGTDSAGGTESPENPARVPGVKLWPRAARYRVAEVQHAGHAVHEEQPIALLSALQHLLEQ